MVVREPSKIGLHMPPLPPRGAAGRPVTPSSGVPRTILEGQQHLIPHSMAGALPGQLQDDPRTPTPVILRRPTPGSGPQLTGLVDFMGREEAFFDKLTANPEATIDKFFRSLDNATNKLRSLGFLNVAVYRPKNDGSGEWVLTHATREFGESAFSRGSVPDAWTSTVGWIIQEGKPNSIYDVDIYEPSTFAASGLPYRPDRAESDRQATIGSGRTLFIKIVSRYGVEAVVQLHNRVLRAPGVEEPPLLLPDDAEEAGHILTLLRHYFRHEVLPTIEAIRSRDPKMAVAPPTPQPTSNRPAKAGVEVTNRDLAALPEVRIGGRVTLSLSFIFQRIKLGLGIRPKEVAKLVDFFNEKGQRIRAYLDFPEKVSDPRSVPWVIIPPAYSKTKETTFLLALYCKMNGLGALRYDDTCSVGESDGEMRDQTFSGSTANIIAAVNYLSVTIRPAQIGLAPFSLSARPSIKAAAQDSRIKFLVPVVGAPNIQSLLRRVCGEDLVEEYRTGKKSGPMNILGHMVDGTNFITDASRADFLDLASTLKDMERVKVPIVWFCGAHDPWVDPEEVRQVLDVNPFNAERDVKILIGLSHRLRESGKAPEVFAEVVRVIKALTTGEDEELVLPKPKVIVAKAVRERARVKTVVTRQQEIDGWTAYLKGYDILLQCPEYKDYLESICNLLDIQPGNDILDVGCGNGNLLTMCLERMASAHKQSGWRNGTVTGVDFVGEALERTREKVQRVKRLSADLPALELQQIDVETEELIHEDGHYDKIVASLFLSYLQAPEIAVKKMCAKLKKGGTIVLTSLKPGADVSQIYARFMDKLEASTASDKKETLERGRNMLNSVMGWIEVGEERGQFKYLAEAELIKMLKANGIEIVETKRSFGDQAVVVVGRKIGKRKKKLTALAA